MSERHLNYTSGYMIHSETHLSEYDRALQQDQDHIMEEGNPDPHPGGGHHGGQQNPSTLFKLAIGGGIVLFLGKSNFLH